MTIDEFKEKAYELYQQVSDKDNMLLAFSQEFANEYFFLAQVNKPITVAIIRMLIRETNISSELICEILKKDADIVKEANNIINK